MRWISLSKILMTIRFVYITVKKLHYRSGIMKKKLFLVMSLFIISLTMIACGGVSTPADNSPSGFETSEKLEIEHQLGTTIVSKNPERVVAFDLGIVDSLDKMGVKLAAIPKGWPVTSYQLRSSYGIPTDVLVLPL